MMPVEINQWRATIWCFHVSIQNVPPLSKTVKPFSTLFQICKLYWFCCCFTAISVLVLPLTLMMQFLAVHFVAKNTPLLPLFARVHRFAKTVIYASIELIKRIPLGIAGLFQYKYCYVRQFLFLYTYLYIGCLTCNTLHTQWLVFRTILLSGDVETNPGPETLDFCCWNLNSITAYDFLRVSLIEAYNSVALLMMVG